MNPDEVRFVADGMLLSLATWLRLLGYDCEGRPGQFGRELLEQAAAERRVFLTRNHHLTANQPRQLLENVEIAQIHAEHLPEQLREVVARFALDTGRYSFTRCIPCNLKLRSIAPTKARLSVPPDVLERGDRLWECPGCGRIFWRGSHVTRSLSILQEWLGRRDEAA